MFNFLRNIAPFLPRSPNRSYYVSHPRTNKKMLNGTRYLYKSFFLASVKYHQFLFLKYLDKKMERDLQCVHGIFSLLRSLSRFRSSRGHQPFVHGLLESHLLREQLPVTNRSGMYSSSPSSRLPPLLYFVKMFTFLLLSLYSQITTQKSRDHGNTSQHFAEEQAARAV